MAWLELAPSGVYKIVLRIEGRKLKRSLDTDNPRLAEKSRIRIEENLRLVEDERIPWSLGYLLPENLWALPSGNRHFENTFDGKGTLNRGGINGPKRRFHDT